MDHHGKRELKSEDHHSRESKQSGDGNHVDDTLMEVESEKAGNQSHERFKSERFTDSNTQVDNEQFNRGGMVCVCVCSQ